MGHLSMRRIMNDSREATVFIATIAIIHTDVIRGKNFIAGSVLYSAIRRPLLQASVLLA